MFEGNQINIKAWAKPYIEHENSADEIVYLSKGRSADHR
jgi:hypothetical protein